MAPGEIARVARGASPSVATLPYTLESQVATTANMLLFRAEYDRALTGDVHNAFRPETYRCACYLANTLATRTTLDYTPSPYVVVINNGYSDATPPRSMRDQVLTAFERRIDAGAPPLRFVAFFCHGEPYWIQFGFNVPNTASHHPGHNTLGDLANRMGQSCAPDVRIAIYACSTGASPGRDHDGINGFADLFSTSLVGAGLTDCHVDAHQTAAHTTRNPRLRRFRGSGGGQWIIEPWSRPRRNATLLHRRGRTLWDRWVYGIRNTELRFLSVFLDRAQIENWLQDPANFPEHSQYRNPLPTE